MRRGRAERCLPGATLIRRCCRRSYSSVDMYISTGRHMRSEYNDTPVVVDEEAFEACTSAGARAPRLHACVTQEGRTCDPSVCMCV